jgi:predicted MFS family arabinose efflux permease
MLGKVYKQYKESLSGLSKEVWILSGLMLINRSGLMVVPFLALYLTEELEFTLIQAGTAGMWFGIGSLLSSLLGGYLTDKYGFARIMKFSLLAGGLSFWSLVTAKTFIGFCSLIFLTALLADLLRPAVMSAIAIYSREENRTRAVSLLRMAINLGIAVGPALGGFLAAKFGYDWLFIINGGSAILTFIIFISVHPTMKKRKIPDEVKVETNITARTAYTDYNYLWLILIMFLVVVAFLQILFAIPLFFKTVYGFTEQMVGFFFTLNGLLIVVFEMPIVNYYEKQRKFYKPVIFGGLLMAIGYLSLLIPASGSSLLWLIPFLIYTLTIGIGEILNLPFFNSLALARSNRRNSGSYMGLMTFTFSLSFTVAPLIGSFIIDGYSFDALWIVSTFLCLLSVALFVLLKDRFLISDQYK